MKISNSLIFVSSCFIEGTCVVSLALAVMTMSGSIFHHGLTLLVLLSIVSCENLSLVYVNSINYTMILSSRFSGRAHWCGNPLIHNRLGLQSSQI